MNTRDIRQNVSSWGAPQRSSLRVFLADDHSVVREGLKTLVNAQPDMHVIGEASEGKAAWERIAELQQNRPSEDAPGGVDVVVMDVSMPGWNGAETTARVTRDWPDIRVLALTMHEDKSYLRSLLEAGAAGYVLKRSAADELIRALRVVAGGGTYLDPSLSSTVMESLVRGSNSSISQSGQYGSGGRPGRRGDAEGTPLPLSDREEEVLRLIAQGHTNMEIGVRLSVSVKTVETYKARSMEKLSLDSRADVVRYALDKGWLRQQAL